MINKKYFISIFCGLFIQGCDGKETSSPVNAQLNTTITGCTITQPSDVPKQISCLQKNAKAGSNIDQYNLAIALRDGLIDGTPNPQEAFFWMKKAAEGN